MKFKVTLGLHNPATDKVIVDLVVEAKSFKDCIEQLANGDPTDETPYDGFPEKVPVADIELEITRIVITPLQEESDCEECLGVERTDCPECSGSGQEDCNDCDDDGACEWCEEGLVDCSYCDGEGETDCPACVGE